MESTILDEDFIGAFPGDDDTGEIDSRDIALERRGIAPRAAIVGLIETHPQPLDEVKVGMVAGERKDEVVRQRYRAFRRFEPHIVFGDVDYRAAEVCFDLSVLDAVVDVGEDPILHVAVHLRAAMDERYSGAMPPEVEGCDGRRVLAADDEYVQSIKRMRLVIVVADLMELFAGDIKIIGQIVVARGDGQFAGVMRQRAAKIVCGVNGEIAVTSLDSFYRLVLADVEAVMLRDFAVVLQRFVAVGLLVWTGKRHIANLQQLRRGEERHVRGIVKQGVAETPFIHQHRGEPCALRLDGAGQSGGAGTDDHQINFF